MISNNTRYLLWNGPAKTRVRPTTFPKGPFHPHPRVLVLSLNLLATIYNPRRSLAYSLVGPRKGDNRNLYGDARHEGFKAIPDAVLVKWESDTVRIDIRLWLFCVGASGVLVRQ
jgi:hypothetical protein